MFRFLRLLTTSISSEAKRLRMCYRILGKEGQKRQDCLKHCFRRLCHRPDRQETVWLRRRNHDRTALTKLRKSSRCQKEAAPAQATHVGVSSVINYRAAQNYLLSGVAASSIGPSSVILQPIRLLSSLLSLMSIRPVSIKCSK